MAVKREACDKNFSNQESHYLASLSGAGLRHEASNVTRLCSFCNPENIEKRPTCHFTSLRLLPTKPALAGPLSESALFSLAYWPDHLTNAKNHI